MPPMTPEEQFALLNFLGMGAYGSPLMESPASQLNLVQDIGSMAFDTVFMYNMGLITSEQLLDGIKNATREPVGDATEYDWESLYNQIVGSGETDKIEGVQAIINGSRTAAQFIRDLRGRRREEGAYETNPGLDTIIDSLEEELEEFETKFNNYNFIQQKVDAGEYDYDELTGMVYKPILGEQAQDNLRAIGWNGPFSNPEFWRTIPDPQLIQEAANLNSLVGETESELERVKFTVQPKAVKQGAKAGSAAYQEFLSRTPEGQRFLAEEQKKATDKPGKSVGQQAKEAFLLGNIPVLGLPVAAAKALPKVVKSIGGTIKDSGFSLPGGKGLDEKVATLKAAKKASENQAYWAKMAESYTARGEQEEAMKPVTNLQKKVETQKKNVESKIQEAQRKGTVPALEWLKMMPQLAAMAAQPAPEAPKPRYVKPKPRTLSDQEIEIMANMIAGGMG